MLKRYLLACLAVLGLSAGVALAQTGQPALPAPVSISGSITSAGGNVQILGLTGQNACTIDVGGTAWTGTLLVQGSTNWDNLSLSSYGSSASISSITANGLYFASIPSLSQIRIVGPASTGTATVYVLCSQVNSTGAVTANVSFPTPLPVIFPSAQPVTATVNVTVPTPLPVIAQTPFPVVTPAGGFAVNQGTSPWVVSTPVPCTAVSCNTTITPPLTGVSGTGTAQAANQTVVGGCAFNTVLPTITSGNVGPRQCDQQGRGLVTVGSALPQGTNNLGGVFTFANPSATAGTLANQVNLGSVSNVKTTPGILFTTYCFNTQASTVAFVQVFNTLAASVTLGTTVPVAQQLLQASTFAYIPIPPTIGAGFGTAISIAATTTAGGATPSASGVFCYEVFI